MQYDYPLPSREYIEQTLAEQGVPMSFAALAGALDIQPHELEHFERRLRAMERDGQLMRNRRDAFLLPDKADLIRGRVEGHPDGFGFLVRDDGQPDIFLGPKEMREVLHGDRAIVRIAGQDRRGRPEGKVVEILERANSRVVGRVLNEHGVMIVVPENRRLAQDILVAPGGKKVQPGQVVTVELIEQPTKYAQPIGRVTEVLGNYADPGMEIEIALRKHDLPFEFSSEAKADTRKLPTAVRKKDWAGREDITALPLVTIDGETAKDFDDAVYCERQGRGFRLVVAIADVSHYVEAGSALDRDAYERGNSVYFPRRVIPMLPEKLSNGLCSLNPQVERLCMVADMGISMTGEIKAYRFYPAVMFSHARLTYTKVAAALYDNDATALDEIGGLLPHLENLDKLFRVLLKARAKRGAIDFETTETRMIFDDNGKIERIVPETRNDAHRLIEECMLAANVCASDFLHKNDHPALYRVHEGPTPEKLEKLRTFLSEFGLPLGGGDEPRAKDYAALLDKVKDRPDAQLLQTVMLRSLRQAVYSPDNVGHFGLAYEAYTHFTSPIRRYPDLLVHRAIKAVLAGEHYAAGDWDDIGLHCSTTERRADEATRDVVAWLKCYYMQDKVGEEFEGSVSAVVPFGLFVALDGIFIEGLLHVSELGADYFHYDEARHAMLGERTGKQFRLSDRVRVQLVRVDMETNKIDFRLVEGPLLAKPARKAAAPATEALVEVPQDAAAPVAPAGGRKRKPAVEKAPQRATETVESPPPQTAAAKTKRARKAPVVEVAAEATPTAAAEPAKASATRTRRRSAGAVAETAAVTAGTAAFQAETPADAVVAESAPKAKTRKTVKRAGQEDGVASAGESVPAEPAAPAKTRRKTAAPAPVPEAKAKPATRTRAAKPAAPAEAPATEQAPSAGAAPRKRAAPKTTAAARPDAEDAPTPKALTTKKGAKAKAPAAVAAGAATGAKAAARSRARATTTTETGDKAEPAKPATAKKGKRIG
ncbi:exoribonuclease II [Azoarcus olearius]|uniref:ribonuclease R n=1 Tax=Azoarcus sp. (strain BH72) TaxID=418699 RepID=UPI00080615B2|nr:ribonuclease R [Azoarcus olearius]ANQ84078.1 exoribonuclease II [Azoarcus olearius]